MAKKVMYLTEKELTYIDQHSLIEMFIEDPEVATGTKNADGIFAGTIDLNALSSVLKSHFNAKWNHRVKA